MNDRRCVAGGRAELRLLRALSRAHAFAQMDGDVAGAMAPSTAESQARVRVYGGTSGGNDVVHHVRLDVWKRVKDAGWVEPRAEECGGWQISAAGRIALRRLKADASGPSTGDTRASDDRGRPRANEERSAQMPTQSARESPLDWLYRRRDRSGIRLISETQLQAGERLRIDFEIAQLRPRLTVDWGRAVEGGGGRAGSGATAALDITDRALAARERFGMALQAVGPDLANVLVDVCCHLKGLEQFEKAAGWPQRSAKIVLQMGLSALARHYGLDTRDRDDVRARSGPARVLHWGKEGYRPSGVFGPDDRDDP